VSNFCAGGSRPWQWISLEVIVKGFKNCSISQGMDGLEDEEEAGNCKDSEAEAMIGMVNRVKLVNLNIG
jgi:hypothetical protein